MNERDFRAGYITALKDIERTGLRPMRLDVMNQAADAALRDLGRPNAGRRLEESVAMEPEYQASPFVRGAAVGASVGSIVVLLLVAAF